MIYLAGPMSGISEHNYPAFEGAVRALRAAGHHVMSPHELTAVDHDNPQPWSYYIGRDLMMLIHACNAIALLPGWEKSKGATLELRVAEALGYTLYDVVDGVLVHRG